MGSAGALDGIRVIDWTVFQQGPAAAMILAELGADVIHVEQPGPGDLMRGSPEVMGIPLALPGGRHVLVEDVNKNKRSLCLDLGKDEGRELMYRLVERSDVFLTNFRPKAVSKLGMQHETLSRLNPRLIYGHTTTFGDRGVEKDSPGLEGMGYGRSGSMLTSGEEGWPPTYLAPGIGDRSGGIFLALGTMVALFDRERTGVGQKLTTSLLGSMIYLQAPSVMITLLTGKVPRACQRERAPNPLHNHYKCRDGRWIILGFHSSDRSHWVDFCKAIDRPDLVDDPRFKDHLKRSENCVELIAVIDGIFLTRTCDEWARRLLEAGDLNFARVSALTDLATDPMVIANNYLVDFDHPILGAMKQVALPIAFSKTPGRIHSPAPACGEHSEEVLREVLGLAEERIAGLRARGII